MADLSHIVQVKWSVGLFQEDNYYRGTCGNGGSVDWSGCGARNWVSGACPEKTEKIHTERDTKR